MLQGVDKSKFTSESLIPEIRSQTLMIFCLNIQILTKQNASIFQHFTENHKILLPLIHSYLASSAGNSVCFSFFERFFPPGPKLER